MSNQQHSDVVAQMSDVQSELERLARFDNLSRSQSLRFESLREEFNELNAERLGIEREADREKVLAAARAGHFVGEGHGLGVERDSTSRHPRAQGVLGEARRMVDDEFRSGRIPDYAAERVEKLITTPVPEDASLAARWALATGREAYRTAFAKLAADPVRGHLLWTGEEGDAFREVATMQARWHRGETRAMSVGSDAGGGFMVPFQLDPSILLTSDGSVNPLRRISRVVQTSSNEWHGVTSAGSSAEWKAEAAEVADASPTLAQPGIPVHFGDAFVPYSFEVGMDALNFLDELGMVLRDAADQLQAEAFMTGSGSGEPTGLVTALPAGSEIAAGTADTFAIDDPVTLQNALPPRFQPRARFLANLTTINALGSFETSGGALRYPDVTNGRLLNRPIDEASFLDVAGATASAGNDNVMVYGDFRQFVIVDRIGSTLELIPHLVGSNNRPTGQRGAMLWFRTGSDVVVDNAFRLLTA